jgi:hypothetical protein
MIAILGLLILVVAVLVATAGVLSNTGSAHPLGGDFTVAGLHLSGLSTGQLFLYGVLVGAVAMLGVSMLLGTFSRRMASRGSQRKLKGSRRETATLRLDHERLTQQLQDERAEHNRALHSTSTEDAKTVGNEATPAAGMPAAAADSGDEPAPEEPADEVHTAGRHGLLHRIGHHNGSRS